MLTLQLNAAIVNFKKSIWKSNLLILINWVVSNSGRLMTALGHVATSSVLSNQLFVMWNNNLLSRRTTCFLNGRICLECCYILFQKAPKEKASLVQKVKRGLNATFSLLLAISVCRITDSHILCGISFHYFCFQLIFSLSLFLVNYVNWLSCTQYTLTLQELYCLWLFHTHL